MVIGSVMVGLALMLGCVPPQGGASSASAYPKTGEKFKGSIEFTLWNHTKFDIDTVEVQGPVDPSKGQYAYPERDYLVSPNYGSGAKILANNQGKWSLKPGKYKITATGPGAAKYSSVTALSAYELDLQAPTELVVYDDPQPPTDVAPPGGIKQVMELSYQEMVNRKTAERQANVQASRDAALAQCKKNIPALNEKPAPGKIKPDGKWTCIIGGEGSGTNYVTLVQLADGKITATMGPGSADRNTSWQGVMVGDEVRFRYTGIEGGGRLKLDPGRKAMSGPGWTYMNEGRCMSWTLTCMR